MNKLRIAKDVNALGGAQGTVTTTEGVSGYQEVLVLFIDKGYTQIQEHRNNWKFMRKMAQTPLNSTTNTYVNADIAKVEKIIYNQTKLKFVPYADWILRDHATGAPAEYTISDIDSSVIFNPLDATYLTDLYYWSVPDVMTLNSSIPVLPIQYHDLLVFKGLMGLGTYLGNYDLVNEYSEKYDIMMGQMMRTECPQIELKAEPFATGSNYHRRNFV